MTATDAPPRARLLPLLAPGPILRSATAVHSASGDQPWRVACSCRQPLWANAIRPSSRCTGYGQRIDPPPYTVQATAPLAAIAPPLPGHTAWLLAAFARWTAGRIVLAFVDLAAAMRLPHRVTAITTAGFLTNPAAASQGKLRRGDATLAARVAALSWHSRATAYAEPLLGSGAPAVTATTLPRTTRLEGPRAPAARPVPDRCRRRRPRAAITTTSNQRGRNRP
ncbi:hypothetical protein AB0C02_31840 [Micromonospora sp. NPDC048999]|uniref:hypothetical protein n=1 Tax=Micromonospora sp. NPDC048999 TaxID=3155391 RepID=UPI0034077D90